MASNISDVYHWLIRSDRRKQILLNFWQPMTAKELSRKTGISFDSCRHVLRELGQNGLVFCINQVARRGRVKWLTSTGKICQRRVVRSLGLAPRKHLLPNIDWALYGWATGFSHRAAVLKAMVYPMQAVVLRRRACLNDPSLKISVSNVHDVLRLFVEKGIVRRIWIKGNPYPCFEIAETGKELRELFLHSSI